MLKLFKNSITLLMRLLVFVLCGGVFFLLMGQKYFLLLRPSRTAAETAVSFGIVYLLMTRELAQIMDLSSKSRRWLPRDTTSSGSML